jgi:hypothetical protein
MGLVPMSRDSCRSGKETPWLRETGYELGYENELLDPEPCGRDDLSKSCHVVVIRVTDLLDEAMYAKTLEHAGNLSSGLIRARDARVALSPPPCRNRAESRRHELCSARPNTSAQHKAHTRHTPRRGACLRVGRGAGTRAAGARCAARAFAACDVLGCCRRAGDRGLRPQRRSRRLSGLVPLQWAATQNNLGNACPTKEPFWDDSAT